jgi:hypothetical protein
MSPEEGIQSFGFFFIAPPPSWEVMKYDAEVNSITWLQAPGKAQQGSQQVSAVVSVLEPVLGVAWAC